MGIGAPEVLVCVGVYVLVVIIGFAYGLYRRSRR